MGRRARLVGPLSSFGGEGRGEEAVVPATLGTGSRNGAQKLEHGRGAVTLLRASSPQPSPPKEERETPASRVLSIILTGSALKERAGVRGSLTQLNPARRTTPGIVKFRKSPRGEPEVF